MPILTNPRHERFAQELAKGKSATEAYEAAGFKPHRQAASRLLTNVDVLARRDEIISAAAEDAGITVSRVLSELGKLGFSNMLDYVRVQDEGDAYVDLSQLTRDQAAAIQEITVEDFLDGRGEDARKVRRVKFKLADKRGSLDLIGKHLGMFKEKIEHSGPGGGPIVTESLTDTELARWLAFKLAGAAKETP